MDIDREEEIYEEYVIRNDYSSDDSEVIIEDSDSESIDINEYLFNIYSDEVSHEVMTHNHYYLGLKGYVQILDYCEIIILSTVSAYSFFEHDENIVVNYLTDFLTTFTYQPKIEIIKLHINSYGVYNAIVKTFWLKIIQRKWKNILKERNTIKLKCMNLHFIINREINPMPIFYPTLQGMLWELSI